jgi:pimeloyl-ACP methyl ester carboxylesterase
MVTKFALLLLLVVLSVISISAGPLNRLKHIGALNVRLQQEFDHRGRLLLTLNEPGADGAKYMNQTLDHFDPYNTGYFQQKYYVNQSLYKPGGPVFFMLGGEGPISPAYLSGHFILNNYAELYNALLVTLEHRFYGETIPNNSSTTQNLQFLSSAQALADAATFREKIQLDLALPADTKWIVFGGSYSGALSAWARLKYPHLFYGAISASAPVLAQLNFPEYMEVVQASVGPQCAHIISDATRQMENLLNSAAGRVQLTRAFNSCTNLTSVLNDQITFLSGVSDPFCGVVQYSWDNNKYQLYNITGMCAQLEQDAAKDGALEAVANFVLANAGQECMVTDYKSMIEEMLPTSDGRSWTYQTCREFGFYQTGDSSNQPFSRLISLDYYLQQCEDMFGIKGMKPNIDWTNDDYGAKGIKTSNTVFTDGSVDPWHILGETTTVEGSSNIVVYISGTAHCADLYPPRASDLPALKYARKIQQQFIGEWLSEGNGKSTKPIIVQQ